MEVRNCEGFYVIDKPYGMSSQRAVQIIKFWARRATGNKKIKVGHAGTLDPLATGVLVIAIGRASTKKIDEIVGSEKEYEARVFFGMTSITDDAEGQKSVCNDISVPSLDEMRIACHSFMGEIMQIPPTYSAIKINGQEAYKRMRRGESVTMLPRCVHITAIDILSYAYPILTIRVQCGKGTYIRSLARDLGKHLGVGAYLDGLVRTRVGAYHLSHAVNMEYFEKGIL